MTSGYQEFVGTVAPLPEEDPRAQLEWVEEMLFVAGEVTTGCHVGSQLGQSRNARPSAPLTFAAIGDTDRPDLKGTRNGHLQLLYSP